jgi:L-fuconolactonase
VIVDAHHHLWDPAKREYAWMPDELRFVAGVDDLRGAAAPLGVGATVAVQAATTEEETLDLLAAAGGLVAAVVGWIDLTAPDPGEAIARLRAAPGGEYLAGIRHPVHDEPDPGWLDRDDVRRGLRAVAGAELPFDLLLFPEHLPAALRLAEAMPELRLVVDHGAKPRIADGGWEPWASGLAGLAGHERIHCKLSGLVTEAGERVSDVPRYGAHLLALFGAERLMFGSDWPVCTLAASYAEVLECARASVAGLGDAEREAVFAGTARRFYGVAA